MLRSAWIRGVAVAAMTLLGSGLPAAGADPGAGAPAAGDEAVVVRIVEGDRGDTDSWRFEPAELSVEAGATVRWVNDGAMAHSVSADDGSFYSPNLAPGEEWERRFPEPGEHPYHCGPHRWMQGGVRVTG